ncbi:MAG: prepilin peptidase [Euryarchaeota archaeon]|nr:prepilin peptidase [Euryarchaeota archaeon]
MLDIIRILVCVPFLLYACHSDLKTRKVPNRTWHLMILIGIMLASIDIYKDANFLIRLGLSVTFLSAFAYILFRIKALGGADAKALIAISVVVPTFPFVPLRGIPFLNLFAFSVFGNAILLMLIVPLSIFVYNLTQLSRDEMKEKPLYLFLGYKSKISELQNRHIKLIESYAEQDGNVVRRFVHRGVDIDDEIVERLQQFAKDGKIPDEVWVTQGLPFMIPLTLGFITALVYGDLMYLITSHLVCMLQPNPYLAFDGFLGSLTQRVNL